MSEITREEIEKLKKENLALKNRCFALSGGTMCFVCPLDCERRNTQYRGEVEHE